MFKDYDIIVIGGGHAGCEAAYCSAKLGSKVLMITMNLNTIGQMSCNPAMGGVAKGQILREIDALGGASAIVADKSTIQFRMLNRSKGAAMWSPRSQNDRFLFAKDWRETLEQCPNISFWQDSVRELVIDSKGLIKGIKTSMGIEINSKAVIVACGTFMGGLIHIGEKSFGGGRMGDKPSIGLTEQFVALGFETGRMKTGTPPRVDGRTINFDIIEEQKGDENPGKFSFEKITHLEEQRSCFITYTNPKVHQILQKSFDKSPMFAGRIKGSGPRYCPSIEDKIDRFSERERHQIFVEPEGLHTSEMYINGFSTSLPLETQYEALKHIRGFEKAKMIKPGYAIEYDFFPPTQLYPTLETKKIKGLFFAGQINGTTGYEEAAAQGLIAGINAHREINELDNLVLARSEAYIGVLIDDLVNKGTNEPYRMFTSRAEYRILLRQDNADIRLTKIGHDIGLASDNRLIRTEKKLQNVGLIIDKLKRTKVSSEANQILNKLKSAEITEKQSLYKLLKRPELNFELLKKINDQCIEISHKYLAEEIEQAEIQIKYESYIQKEKELVEKTANLENTKIPSSFNYDLVTGLSSEGKQKLENIKPITIGQATRISGVSPADVSILMVHMGR